MSAVLVAAAATFLAGCAGVDGWPEHARSTKPFRPDNYASTGDLPRELVRVCVLPVHSSAWTESDLSPIDGAFGAELSKKDRFELVLVGRDAMRARFSQSSFASTDALPERMLGRLAADFGADGVLFVDLTHYSPYQPISMGIRAKLVAVSTGAVVWSIDSVFDSSQPEVALAARRYSEDSSRSAHPLRDSSGMFQSPARFSKYVANAVFDTLPKRERGNTL
ncbi:hypothetical protein ASA1KI_08720 [Opitutales bacterium ASA1]|uniref:hypothetical protein n=1 Tax=Congregicoccus parvus TaxID=3081749 RepID=UPI002B28FDAF|nr:hypothetical protein ASA1KI_08720 [Opitutales bacterium ASA1]